MESRAPGPGLLPAPNPGAPTSWLSNCRPRLSVLYNSGTSSKSRPAVGTRNPDPLPDNSLVPANPSAARRKAPSRCARKATLCAAAVCLAAIALAACGGSGGPPPPIAAAELAAARSFPYYTLYWVGASFEGKPLTAADGIEGYKPLTGDSLYYGDCMEGGLLSASGCVMPLKITTSVYALHRNVDLGPQRNTILRGVPAAVYNEGRAIELYTGRLVIDVHSNDYAKAQSAVLQLQPLNAGGSAATPLPLPVYCPMLYGPRPPALKHLMARLPGGPCQSEKQALAQQRALRR